MASRINILDKTMLILVLIAFMTSFVNAFGVSSPVWKGNPLQVSPGEIKITSLTLQNMGTTEDITVRAILKEGHEISSMQEKEYLVKANTKDTEVPITVTIPSNIPIDTDYIVVVSFETINSGEGGGVVLGTGIDTTFDVLVVPAVPVEEAKEPQLAPEVEESSLIWWVIGGIIVVIIIIIIIKKGKKKLETMR